jgi:hypothetical protein
MEISAKVFWVFTLGISSGQAGQKPSVTVLVYNYTAVSSRNLAAAEVWATRSYSAAGIAVSWVECPVSAEDSARFRACEQALDKHPVFINIIPARMAEGFARSPKASEDTLGMAFGFHAFVLYERIVQWAGIWGLEDSVILGHTLAHELGHLLLGDQSHSATGVMRPLMQRQDFSLESGQFLFLPKQARKLRALMASFSPRLTSASSTHCSHP